MGLAWLGPIQLLKNTDTRQTKQPVSNCPTSKLNPKHQNRLDSSFKHKDVSITPSPTPDFLTKDFCLDPDLEWSSH